MHAVSFPAVYSSKTIADQNVCMMGQPFQMKWIYAPWIVAAMMRLLAIRRIPAQQHVSKAMGAMRLSVVIRENTISVFVLG